MPTAEALIQLLQLEPHPAEGGFFKETYRSAINIASPDLETKYGSARSASTCIYYLLTEHSFSRMHQLKTDEIFHFYLGDPVEMLMLHPNGHGENQILGPDVLRGQSPQIIVPADSWQGLRLKPGGRMALLGTTVAPGFDFADFSLGNRQSLMNKYPGYSETIFSLT